MWLGYYKVPSFTAGMPDRRFAGWDPISQTLKAGYLKQHGSIVPRSEADLDIDVQVTDTYFSIKPSCPSAISEGKLIRRTVHHHPLPDFAQRFLAVYYGEGYVGEHGPRHTRMFLPDGCMNVVPLSGATWADGTTKSRIFKAA